MAVLSLLLVACGSVPVAPPVETVGQEPDKPPVSVEKPQPLPERRQARIGLALVHGLCFQQGMREV